MKPSLADFFTAHIEWLGLRSSLIPPERRAFTRWVARAHPELAKPYLSQPAEFRLTCQEVQRGGAAPVPRGIAERTLQKHAPALVQKYRSLPVQERGTFQAFLNGVLAACPTERALLRYLGTAQSS